MVIGVTEVQPVVALVNVSDTVPAEIPVTTPIVDRGSHCRVAAHPYPPIEGETEVVAPTHI